jgi:hypothetical protein
MAQEFTQQPKYVSFSDNPIVYAWYEDTQYLIQDEFRWNVEVYINSSLHSTHVIYIQDISGGDAYAKFDVSDIVKQYAIANKRTTLFLTDIAPTEVYIKVTAEYDGGSLSPLTSNTVNCIKGKLTKQDFVQYIDNDLFLTSKWESASGFQFFTQFPRTEKYWCGLDEDLWLTAINSGATDTLRVTLYDVAGSSIVSATKALTEYIASLIEVSPSTIVAETTVVSADFDECYYYTIEVRDDVSLEYSEPFKIYIDRGCSRFTHSRLIFLGKCGSLEAWTFKMISRPTAQVTAKETKSIFGTWQGGEYVFDLEQGEFKTHLTESVERIELNTDWINDETHNWLVENLMTSPYIIMQRDGIYQRMVIEGTSYEKKKNNQENLFNVSLTLKYSHTNSSMLL